MRTLTTEPGRPLVPSEWLLIDWNECHSSEQTFSTMIAAWPFLPSKSQKNHLCLQRNRPREQSLTPPQAQAGQTSTFMPYLDCWQVQVSLRSRGRSQVVSQYVRTQDSQRTDSLSWAICHYLVFSRSGFLQDLLPCAGPGQESTCNTGLSPGPLGLCCGPTPEWTQGHCLETQSEAAEIATTTVTTDAFLYPRAPSHIPGTQ
jgi:hypothetical protein